MTSASWVAAVAAYRGAAPTTYTVSKTADTNDGVCNADCSLREAISVATSGNTITFNPAAFPTGTPATISLTSTLPFITQGNITIDASNAGVIIDGSALASGNGLEIASSNNTIKGLRIQNFDGSYTGIIITSGNNNTIGGDSTIGTGPSGEGNILVNNTTGIGVYSGVTNTTYTGNYIGTDPSSNIGLGNTDSGIVLGNSNNNIVGGTTAGARNIISGNTNFGINIGNISSLNTNNNTIIGNYIGTNVAGTAALANDYGIQLRYTQNDVIGGTAPGEGNLISGNTTYGIVGANESVFSILGNYFATDAAGTGTITTPGIGIVLTSIPATLNVTIGDPAETISNTIAPHGGVGIHILSGVALSIAGTLNVNDDIEISSGASTINLGTGSTINLTGNWINAVNATVNAGTSTLNLDAADGATQAISGDNNFYNLNRTVTGTSTLNFAGGSTQTIVAGGNVTLQGAAANLLSLRSTSSPTQWNLNINTTAGQTIQYVDVQDGNVSGSAAGHKPINPANSNDTSNNTDWFSNAAPIGGFTADDVIPLAQISQATNGSGVLTINWKARDDDADNVTLNTFEYSVDGGSTWNAPTNADTSLALSANWDDNGSAWSSATTFAAATAHSFTFNTQHADVTGLAGIDQADVQVRFTVNDGTVDSVAPATSVNVQVDNALPTATYTSAAYNSATNTLTIIGTNFTSIATASTDIRTLVDWTRFIWDINATNGADISFVVGDVTSLTVTNATTLTLLLTGAKATAIEGAIDFGAAGGADALDISVGFSIDAFGNVATTDAVANAPIAAATYTVSKTADTNDYVMPIAPCAKPSQPQQPG